MICVVKLTPARVIPAADPLSSSTVCVKLPKLAAICEMSVVGAVMNMSGTAMAIQDIPWIMEEFRRLQQHLRALCVLCRHVDVAFVLLSLFSGSFLVGATFAKVIKFSFVVGHENIGSGVPGIGVPGIELNWWQLGTGVLGICNVGHGVIGATNCH